MSNAIKRISWGFIGAGIWAVILLLLATCMTGCVGPFERDRGGIDAPNPTVKAWAREGIDIAIVELGNEGADGLRWDHGKWRLEIVEVPASGRVIGGLPTIRMSDGRYVWGFVRHNRIHVPPGAGRGTIIHEVGHVVLNRNGHWSTDVEEHHRRFPRFFRRYKGH